MAGREAYVEGLELLAEDDVDAALEKLNQAVEAEPTNADYLLKRSSAHSKRKDAEAAEADAAKAAECAPQNPNTHFRHGILKFEREAFKEALTCFELAKGLAPNEKLLSQIGTWTRKCKAELSDEEIELGAAAPGPEATKDGASAAPTGAAAAPPKEPAFPFDWYQSLSHVTIEISTKGIPKEKVKHEITATSVAVDIALESTDQTYSFNWELFGEIAPEASKIDVGKRLIEIRLKKVDTSQQWPSLEAGAGSSTAMAAPSTSSSGAAAPAPSAYASKKNWDAISKEIDEEDDKPEGEEALNKLFQDIYKNASEDTRRAMIKSFQTSGGTVLSTNWDEVSKKDYETDRPAPKGMQWKNWDGDKLDVGDDSDEDK